MEEQQQRMAMAEDLMAQFVNAGLIHQDSDKQFTVHGSHGDRTFEAFQNQE